MQWVVVVTQNNLSSNAHAYCHDFKTYPCH